jgi:hypothetical protein
MSIFEQSVLKIRRGSGNRRKYLKRLAAFQLGVNLGASRAPLIWIKPVRLGWVGNAGVMRLNDLWFILSLVWLVALVGGVLFAIFV